MSDTPPRNETELNRQILSLGRGPTRLFRNNIGDAWQGDADVIRRAGTISVNTGDVVIRNARRVSYGVCNPGGSDTIGWHVVTVTLEMVGCQLPVFLGAEGKFGRNKPTVPQINFINAINASGGIGVVAYSINDLQLAIQNWKPVQK